METSAAETMISGFINRLMTEVLHYAVDESEIEGCNDDYTPTLFP